ncbi:TPA: dTDP-4-dehydrorhamnose 3,5-epimerase [Enterobacter asburiae]|jgi:dTDP-4-dehydrorhamnose 3,5-epimerase|uniref:dTDP-4-dehydrorhamnose 3,5-epimerase n=1 Tax=Enterobacter vonholyi TaxID=2797505 RepID=A0ABU6E3A1_9ENTR|nr:MULTISPECIES: dTDP-4-dehydrorhamnose 3,5-epimerase [Enterobacter]AZV06357.1 dTDP-4-dehydrorhamnose 3,5-epimerase [Enterobacter sp. N18-03635]EGQ5322301.1 dTDP-4-dehydrorhamnose 3,5-epimerase [Enterobacter asburiae]EHN8759128.1 dTDP-4-dehydrorhamnose 3,5-epimerase [Enterobacter asburiae]EHN8803329.1 dTDP-4-dehydrorhamnose 3,5-epimerase [Enterobacter asburiae]EKS7205624.1 dTDP-4-dehydrorhamnose 3,5-epimerase [Enterobacter asburiae]
MNIIKTKLDGLLIIEPKVFGDERGFFYETYHEQRYKNAGIKESFVQDNRSRSTGNVLRGLHFQKRKPQGKLVTVTAGTVFDVAVDLREDSPTFGQYESIILSGDNRLQFYIPPGFAHGFCVLSDIADFQYKCTDFYDPTDEGGIIWNDNSININWPISEPNLSLKDKELPSLEDVRKQLKFGK